MKVGDQLEKIANIFILLLAHLLIPKLLFVHTQADEMLQHSFLISLPVSFLSWNFVTLEQ